MNDYKNGRKWPRLRSQEQKGRFLALRFHGPPLVQTPISGRLLRVFSTIPRWHCRDEGGRLNRCIHLARNLVYRSSVSLDNDGVGLGTGLGVCMMLKMDGV